MAAHSTLTSPSRSARLILRVLSAMIRRRRPWATVSRISRASLAVATRLALLAALCCPADGLAQIVSGAVGREASLHNNTLAAPAVADALAREYSVWNNSQASAPATDATGREVTLWNNTSAQALPTDAASRELSILNNTTATVAVLDAASCEFSIYNNPLATVPITDNVGRELSIFNNLPLSATTSSESREVSLWNSTLMTVLTTDATSRELSLFNNPAASLFNCAASREFSLYNNTQSLIAFLDGTSREYSIQNELSAPADAGSCTSGDVVLTWPAIPGATGYRLEIATAPLASSVVSTVSLGNVTTYIYTGGIEGQTYYARKSASFNGGSSYADASVFSDGITIDRTAPLVAAPVGQTVGTSQVRFVFQATDSGPPLRFRLQISAAVSFAPLYADTLLDAGLQEFTLGVPPGQTYFCRCQAIDCAGNTSAWSAPSAGVFVASLPDLAVGSVTAAPTGTSGNSVGVSWQIQNVGLGSTTVSSWIERVYLSPDSLLTQLTSLGDFPSLSYLLPGENYGRSATVTLPRGISGNYYLVVLVDANGAQPEANETNNRKRASAPTAVTLQNYADLRVINVGAGDFAISGDSVSVVWTVKNVGTIATEASNWQDQVFLSSDSTLTYSFVAASPETQAIVLDPHLATDNHQGGLAPGAQYTQSRRFKLPYPLTPGKYYIAIATDWTYLAPHPIGTKHLYNGNVYEYTEELANWRSDATNISLPPTPDLVVTAVQPPTQVTAGQLANVTWTVNNIGGGDPPEASWFDRIYISTSPQFNAQSATSLGDFLQLANPLPNPSSPADTAHLTSGIFPYSKNAQVRIPNGYQGTHYFHLITDVQDGVFENGADSNNVRTSSSFNVTRPPSPDLRIDFVTSTTTGQAGDSTTVIFQVTNAGSAIASSTSWTDQILIVRLDESNAPIPGSDRILKNLSRTQALATGATYQPVERVLLPAELAAGTYAMKVQVDQADVIYENAPEATNSALGQAVTLQAYPTVDLVAEQVTTSASAIAGDSLTVSWRIRNIGAARTLTSWWTDGVYLSADNQLDAGDQKLAVVGKTAVAFLGPNESYAVTRRVLTPRDLSTTAFFLIKADDGGVVSEVAETNNVGPSNTIAFQLPVAVDLQVDSIAAPPALIAGQPAQIRITISNHGPGSIPATNWYDDLYLSSKPYVDGTAIRLKQWRANRNLPAGSGYSDTADVQIPNHLAGGQFLIARTDVLNELSEVNRDANNATVLSVNVTGQPLTDLAVEAITASDTATVGESVLVSWELMNLGPGTATGFIEEGVFLSRDQLWDATDAVVGLHTTHVNITPTSTDQAAHRLTLSGEALSMAAAQLNRNVPGATPDQYYLVVRSDLRNAFRETDETNNTGSSSTRTSIGIQELAVNVTSFTTISSLQSRHFSLALPHRGDWKIEIAASATEHGFAAYWDTATVPQPSLFQYAAQSSAGSIVLIVPDQGPVRGYLSVLSNRSSATDTMSLGLQIRATELPLAISNVAPSVVGTGDRVTIEIGGSRFGANSRAILRNRTSGGLVSAQANRRLDSTRLRARWNLESAALGSYDLLVVSGLDTTLLEQAITLEPPTGYVLENQTRFPDVFRGGSTTQLVYRFRNTGNIDIPFATLGAFLPPGTTVPSVDSGFGTLVPGAYVLDLAGLQNGGRKTEAALETVEVTGGTAELLQSTFYDIAPGEIRELRTIVRPGNSDLFRSTSMIKVYSACGYLQAMAELGEYLRQIVRQRATEFQPYVLSASQDSLAFLHAYTNFLWGQQDSLISSELTDGCPTSQNGQPRGDIDRSVIIYNSTSTSSPEESAQGRSVASEPPRPPVNLSPPLGGCTKCPSPPPGPCPTQVGPSDSHQTRNCICYTIEYSQDSCKARMMGACIIAGGVVSAGPFFGPVGAVGAVGAVLIFDISVACGIVLADPSRENPKLCPPGEPHCVCRAFVQPCDPNDIVGPVGVGSKNWVSTSTPFNYSVGFENDSTLATTAARRVEVSCAIPSSADLRTIRLKSFGFGPNEYQIPGDRSFYSARISVGDSAGTLVDVVASLDAQTRTLRWIFDTIEPTTGQEPTDPRAGFLPVNDTLGSGTGHVDFSFEALPGVATATVLDVGAEIVFDTNPAVATNRARNTIDSASPSSRVLALPELAGDGSVDVWWTAEDDSAGSEVASVSLYSAKDGGMFGLVASGLSAPPFKFEGEIGHVYSFYSVARDTAGNSEGAKNVAEATVRLTGSPIVWPGDTNNDTFVDEFDVLPLGRFFDAQGPARDSVSVRWVPREATGWVTPKAVFADANGDGRVNQNDLLAVGLNFGKRRTAVASTRPPEHIAEISLGGFAAGTTIELQVDLDATQAADVMGGAALQLVYPPEYLEPESVKALAADADNVISLLKTDVRGGRCSIGLAGQGKAAQLLIGRDGHLTLTLAFRTKAAPAKGATVSIEGCEALVGDVVTRDVNVSLSSDFAVDRPGVVRLLQNTPNPFATRTVFQFELPKAGEVSLQVFDVAGRLVAAPINRTRMTAGIHQVGLDGSDWASGIYFTELQIGSDVRTRKMLVLR